MGSHKKIHIFHSIIITFLLIMHLSYSLLMNISSVLSEGGLFVCLGVAALVKYIVRYDLIIPI